MALPTVPRPHKHTMLFPVYAKYIKTEWANVKGPKSHNTICLRTLYISGEISTIIIIIATCIFYYLLSNSIWGFI